MCPYATCRSWFFVEGANRQALSQAASSGADVLVQELEDFTPPEQRPTAHALAADTFAAWRAAGAIAGVRINPLGQGGRADLAGVMPARPDFVALPKVAGPDDIAMLARAVATAEADLGVAPGQTRLVPNIETAAALVQAGAIARASPRVAALMLASEDMAADLGAERLPDCAELAYVRQRFLVECRAVGVPAVDCPYTWSDVQGLRADALWARRMGYGAKSVVARDHAAVVNGVFTPDVAAIAHARRLIAAFEAARARGEARAMLDGALIEMPAVTAARRLLARAKALGEKAVSPSRENR